MYWSTFSVDSLEREYQAELGTEKVRLTRILTGLGIVLTLAFVPLDLFAIPSALIQVWSIRGLMVAGLAAAFISTALPGFQRYYEHVIVLVATVLGGGVTTMVFVAASTDVAIDAYYGGLLLIIMAIHTLTYVNLSVSTTAGLTLTGVYTSVLFFRHGFDAGSDLVTLGAQSFMLLSTTAVGVAAQVLRDRYSRENYLLRHSLEHDVEIKEAESRHASYLAEHDPLTGLANRLGLEKDVDAMIDGARERGAIVQLLFVDLDNFKPINDGRGHAVGDRVLKLVAERLRCSVRAGDVVARVGGDEFVVAMTVSPANATAGAVAAEKMLAAIREGMDLRGEHLDLSASIGVAGFPIDGNDLDTVLQAADAQMYVVKNRGKGSVAVTPGCQAGRLAG